MFHRVPWQLFDYFYRFPSNIFSLTCALPPYNYIRPMHLMCCASRLCRRNTMCTIYRLHASLNTRSHLFLPYINWCLLLRIWCTIRLLNGVYCIVLASVEGDEGHLNSLWWLALLLQNYLWPLTIYHTCCTISSTGQLPIYLSS